MSSTLRLGTRGSQLALAQSREIGKRLGALAQVSVEIEVITTAGDRDATSPLPEIGGKGLFTLELDRGLIANEIDLAVHSLKDLPTQLEDGLELVCVPDREDPRDVLVGPVGSPISLATLPAGARVGTSSQRRGALLRAFRPDLTRVDVRGNLDTRLRKLDEGGYDALILAAAGLRRLGLTHRVSEFLETSAWLPAPGQGALGIVGRVGDERVARALEPLRNEQVNRAVLAERAMLGALEGGCQLPIGAFGMPFADGLRLRGQVLSPDGSRVVRGDLTGSGYDPVGLGRELADLLLDRGAGDLLSEVDGAVSPP